MALLSTVKLKRCIYISIHMNRNFKDDKAIYSKLPERMTQFTNCNDKMNDYKNSVFFCRYETVVLYLSKQLSQLSCFLHLFAGASGGNINLECCITPFTDEVYNTCTFINHSLSKAYAPLIDSHQLIARFFYTFDLICFTLDLHLFC